MLPAQLQQHLLEHIPLARAMAVTVAGFDGNRLHLQAPLAPNRNDKGCAFGGSLASVMTLAGWGVALLRLHPARGEIYVQDSQLHYLAPVFQDLQVVAWLPDDDNEAFARTFRMRGRARATAMAECRLDDGSVAATLAARFVALDPDRRG